MRNLVMVVVTAMAGLVMPPAMPAGAVTAACPDLVDRAGFVDLTGLGSEAIDAIDCVAHHGVTRGTTATTFGPGELVSRWQMALFLVRAAEAIGVDVPDGVGSAFADVGDLDLATRRAVTQIAQLGITSGTGPATFAPYEPVPRWQMALFLNRLLSAAGLPLPDHVPQGFTDLAGLSLEAQVAVDRATQLGIARGTGPGTYSPSDLLTRSQMALFLARTLEVGAATPWRISLSVSNSSAPAAGGVIATAVVSKPNGEPLPGVLVDVFVTDGDPTTGSCVVDRDAFVNGGDAGTSVNCQIDSADPRSDPDGEVSVGLAHGLVAETDTVVAWLGKIGDTFGVGRDRATASVAWSAVAQGLTLPNPMEVAFGGQAFVSALVLGGGGGVAAQTVMFTVTRSGVPLLARSVLSSVVGVATLDYPGPVDPTSGDDPPVVDVIVAWWDRNGNGIDDGAGEPDAATSITWDEPAGGQN